MMKSLIWCCGLAVSQVVSTIAYADQTYICTNGQMKREISVVYDDQTKRLPCDVQYYKDAGAMKVWRSTSMADYCEEKAQTLVKHQLDLGWKCTDREHGSQVTADKWSATSENQVEK